MGRVILIGDVREQLATLPADHFHCVVTSPPYWALRDYGVAGQLGLEPTVQEYVANMVAVFREVRRVLRPDGVCWVNIGDTYSRNPAKGGSGPNGKHDSIPDYGSARRIMASSREGSSDGAVGRGDRPGSRYGGVKGKNRVGVPHRLVFGLQDDGWWWRDEVVWWKPAPMPESVKDRTTKAHEFIFMLSRSPRYFYDVIAASEPNSDGSLKRFGKDPRISTANRKAEGMDGHVLAAAASRMPEFRATGRQPRSVWKIATAPLKAAHFAAYPPELVRRCLIGSVSEKGCCPTCGAPWLRVTEKQRRATRPGENNKQHFASGWASQGSHNSVEYSRPENHAKVIGNRDAYRHVTETITTGWRQSCKCEAHEPVPCRVIDPFHGAGTTMKVCERLGLDYVGTELNPAYVQISLEREPVKFPHEKVKGVKRKARKHAKQTTLWSEG